MKLSICIPTDDQRDLLKHLLHSIQPEITEGVELVICDNASTDQSELVARDFVKYAPRTLYYKCSKKIPFQQHVAETMDLAKGEYCWLLRPGDILKQGALHSVLEQLEKTPELAGLSVRALPPEASLSPWPLLFPKEDRSYRNVKSCLGDLLLYFRWSSAHLALRKPWLMALKQSEHLKESSLSFSLAKVIIERPNWTFLSTPLIQLRQEETSLLPEFEKTAVSCADLVGLLLGRASPLYFAVLNRMCLGPLSTGLKVLRRQKESLSEQTLQIVFKKYWAVPAFWTHQFPSLLADHPLVNKALSFYHRLARHGKK